MEKTEREKLILSKIEETGFMSVDELAKLLYVSPSSIRRDLGNLEKKKLVKRVYGGAVLIESVNANTPFDTRRARNVEQKKRAAQNAAFLLHDSMSVMLDGSSTSMQMLKFIGEHRNIRLFTNNTYTFHLAVDMGINTCCIGGKPSADASSLSGEFAEEMVEKIFPDILFFSAKYINENGDITDSLEGETRLRRLMMKNAKTTVFLVDKEKVGKTSLYKVCNLKDVDYAFCEDGSILD